MLQRKQWWLVKRDAKCKLFNCSLCWNRKSGANGQIICGKMSAVGRSIGKDVGVFDCTWVSEKGIADTRVSFLLALPMVEKISIRREREKSGIFFFNYIWLIDIENMLACQTTL